MSHVWYIIYAIDVINDIKTNTMWSEKFTSTIVVDVFKIEEKENACFDICIFFCLSICSDEGKITLRERERYFRKELDT